MERFGKPGKTLIGSDSHTPTGGALGMLAMGAGAAWTWPVAMAGGAYYINMPRMFKVNLTGKLPPWVSAKDISLEILRILSVRGGRGAIIEWGGEGIQTLSVPERATITNMGTELGQSSAAWAGKRTSRPSPATRTPATTASSTSTYPRSNRSAPCPHSPDNGQGGGART